jgi:hypothetical protein
MGNCFKCKIKTSNPKFCSRSCSASYNNSVSPKRKRENQCFKCKKPIVSSRKYCEVCRTYPEDITLKQAIYTRHHKSSAYALVRARARAVIAKHGVSKCQKCSYSKHVEAAHIKAISSFDEETLLSAINHPSNLISLCPNCHWEFDKGLLE